MDRGFKPGRVQKGGKTLNQGVPKVNPTGFNPSSPGQSIPFLKMSNPSASPAAVVAEDMSCKVFVGNLSYQTRESELKDIFSKAGNV